MKAENKTQAGCSEIALCPIVARKYRTHKKKEKRSNDEEEEETGKKKKEKNILCF